MAEDPKQPDSSNAGGPDAPKPADPSLNEPAAGDTSITSDAEKSSTVEDAKARVIAAKEALNEKAAAVAPAAGATVAPKPPVKKKEEAPKPTDAAGHPRVKELKAALNELTAVLNGGVLEASEFLGQLSIRID